jgi:hypothetical protein
MCRDPEQEGRRAKREIGDGRGGLEMERERLLWGKEERGNAEERPLF